ncbi:MAG: sugar transferase [Candidatus Binataceae bacterium]
MFNSELRRQKTLLAAADAAAVAASIATSALVSDYYHGDGDLLRHTNLAVAAAPVALVCIAWIFSARTVGLYSPGDRRGEQLLAIIKASVITALMVLTACFLSHKELPRLLAGVAFASSLVLVPTLHAAVQWTFAVVYAHPRVTIPIAIIGCNSISRYVCDQILEVYKQYELLGFLSERGGVGDDHRGLPVLGGIEALPALAERYHNLEVAIILPDFPREMIDGIIRTCERRNLRWRLMPELVGWKTTSSLKIDMIGVIPLIGPPCPNLEGLNFTLKRIFDLSVASLTLLVSAPAMLLAAGAVWLFDGPPLLFRQTRVGIHGQLFQLLKFRTMSSATTDVVHRDYVRSWIRPDSSNGGQPNSDQVFKLVSDPRVTRVGKWLRWLSIDELPQLINVLRGDMSLVGPRPALPYELDLYQDWHRRRLSAMPGITGLWQVSGRNRLSFDQMVKLDIRYIEEWSFGEDLRILIRTVPALLGGGH